MSNLDKEQRDSLLELRAAIDALLEKGYGEGRGANADDASTRVAAEFGWLPIEQARSKRLLEALVNVCMTCDGTSSAGVAALRDARRVIDHEKWLAERSGRPWPW